tara:strand:+ start:535 stop:726 length:192 start_codon:yes stop_codon:yes gene_type:complete
VKPTNDYEAYNLALRLALTASTEEKAQECIDIAEAIGQTLPESFKTKCRKNIEQSLQELEQCK